MNKNEFYAKSNGIKLFDHLVATAEKCAELAKMQTTDKELILASYLCGLFHDLGKATSEFQNHLLKNTKTNNNHSYVSVYLIKKYINLKDTFIGLKYGNDICKSILHHHPLMSDKEDNFNDDMIDSDVVELIKDLISHYNNSCYCNDDTYSICFNDSHDNNIDIDKTKYLTDTESNVNLIFMSCITRFADIITSSNKNNIDNFINIKNIDNVKIEKPEFYDERFYEQNEMSTKLCKHHISVFDSQTGYGKTMLGLLYMLKHKNKGYWICPRNSIAIGVYKTLQNELLNLGLNNTISIALMLTGEYKECNNNEFLELYNNNVEIPDIIVTNIDSFFRPLLKTDSNIRNFNLIHNTCIFDEFHEYFTDEAILTAYNSIMYCRKKNCNNAKTLLLSATTVKLLYEPFYDNKDAYYYVDSKILDKKINLQFDVVPSDLKGMNVFNFYNSVSCSQTVKQGNITDDIIHSRYTSLDLEDKYNLLYQQHGKQSKNRDYSWVGTSIIATGMDISFKDIYINNPTPDLVVQICGRQDRFFEYQDEIPNLYINLSEGKLYKSECCVINSFYTTQLMRSFYVYLKEKLNEGVHTLKDIYKVRKDFMEINNSEYNKLFETYRKKSNKAISSISYSYSNKLNDNNNIRISDKTSLRSSDSDKIFIQILNNDMAEPIQVDLKEGFVSETVLRDNMKNTKKCIKKIKAPSEYFKNKYHKDNVLKKNDVKLYEWCKDNAKWSNKPYLINTHYNYSKILGFGVF